MEKEELIFMDQAPNKVLENKAMIQMLKLGIIGSYKEYLGVLKTMQKLFPEISIEDPKDVFKEFLNEFFELSNEEKNEIFKEAIKKANEEYNEICL